jgi:hypothetical protein
MPSSGDRESMSGKGSIGSALSHPCRENGVRFLRAFFASELRAWHGYQSLWKVFWGYGVLVSIGLALLYLLALEEKRLVISSRRF